MVKIAIVGAGQAGLQLALGLLQNDYDVTLVTDKTSDQILNGSILSNQAMFSTALSYEDELGINHWKTQAPHNWTVNLSVVQNKEKHISWEGHVNHHFMSVDQRIKFSTWIEDFKRLGGNLVYQSATKDTLEDLAQTHELVIVATGKGELSNLFTVDEEKTVFATPQRALACFYAKNVVPVDSEYTGLRAYLLPGIGDFFIMPGLTKTGMCEMLLFEGIIGGEWDCWKNNSDPSSYWEQCQALLAHYVPWEAERCKNASLADDKAFLIGRYAPLIRQPIAKLPSGKFVLGMGDAVVLNDPIAGQGANNASKCAHVYLNSIINSKDYDNKWMVNTFQKYWNEAQWATKLSNLLLTPPSQHLISLLESAQRSKTIANTVANAFENPKEFLLNISSPEKTQEFISTYISEENKTELQSA